MKTLNFLKKPGNCVKIKEIKVKEKIEINKSKSKQMDDINQILTKNANVQKRNVFSFKNTVKYNYSQKKQF